MRISVWSSDVSLPICVPGSDRGQFLYRRRTAPALHSHLGRSYRANLPVGRDAGELLHLCEQAPRALHRRQIGGATCREGGCQSVEISVVAGSYKNTKTMSPEGPMKVHTDKNKQ